VAAGSAVSWLQINRLGEQDFRDETLRDSVGNRSPKSLAVGTPSIREEPIRGKPQRHKDLVRFL
jgi:hypothetical protein